MKYIKHIILTAFAMVVMMGAWAQTYVEHCSPDTTKWCFEMPNANQLLQVEYYHTLTLSHNAGHGTVEILRPGSSSTISIAENVFQWCYDCQRHPAYPTVANNGNNNLSGFSDPYVGLAGIGYGFTNSSSGPWKLEYVGQYSHSEYSFGVSGVRYTYGLNSDEDVPIFLLYQWDGSQFQPVVYGVVCAYSNLANEKDHTLLFEAEGHWGCFLSKKEHPQNDDLYMGFDEDLSSGLPNFVGAATPALPDGVYDNHDGTYSVIPGTQVTIEAIANTAEYYYFDNWTNEQGSEYTTGVVTPTGSRPATSLLTLTITGDTTVRGNFRIDTFDLKLSTNNANMGHIDIGGQQYESKDTMLTDHQHIDVTAIPEPGYYFVNWTNLQGDTVSTSITLNWMATTNATFTANFAAYATLQVASNNPAWGTVEEPQVVAGNTNHKMTIYDESENTTNNSIPAYTCWFNALTKSQHIIPASKMADAKGGTISSIKYYMEEPVTWTSTVEVDVYLKEVGYSTLNDMVDKDSCTVVYTGLLHFVDDSLTITFTNPYTYKGGNLLVGFENLTADAYYCGIHFMGEEVPGASMSSIGSNNLYQQNFLPQCTFTYQPAGAKKKSDDSYYIIPGSEVKVTATPTAGHQFVKWTDENSNVMGTDAQLTFTITGDTTTTANFQPIITYPLTLASNDETMGTVAIQTTDGNKNIIPYDSCGVDDCCASEEYQDCGRLFNNGTSSGYDKWCTKAAQKFVEFHTENPELVNGYTLYTGNDNTTWGKGRNPKSWVLKAKLESNDSWTTIATVNDDKTMKDIDETPYDFSIDVPGIYQYFRFEVSEVKHPTDSVLQLGEMQLFYQEHLLPEGVTPGTTSNTYIVEEGTEVTVIATPKTGHHFVNWTDEEDHVMGTDTHLMLTITGDTTATAKFQTTITYPLTLASNDETMGTVAIQTVDGTKETISYTSYRVDDCCVSMPEEVCEKLFDDNTSSGDNKWCTKAAQKFVEFHTISPELVNGYTLFTGNDNASIWGKGRNPKSWVLKAKSGNEWITIATVNNDYTMKDTNSTPYDFSIDVPGIYQYFRFEVSAVQHPTDSVMQLGEMQLFYQEHYLPDGVTPGTASNSYFVDEGTEVTVIAKPKSGYDFLNWEDNSTNATRTVTVTRDTTLTATFDMIPAIPGLTPEGELTTSGTRFLDEYGNIVGTPRLMETGGLIDESVVPVPVPVINRVDLSALTDNYVAKDGDTLTGTLGANVKISIADGATVTLDGVTINGTNDGDYEWAGLNCLGNATIVLKDGTTNTVRGFYEDYPGIHVPKDKTLTIQGGSEGTGKLTASPFDGGTNDSYGAGIGGGYQIACGDISIEGGVITATGGSYAAGIGSVKATCGNISITGGTVTATGGQSAAGIGSGVSGSTCGAITITTGVTKVTATKGSGAPNSIGAGNGGTCGTVTIGGVVTGNITTSPYTYPAPAATSLSELKTAINGGTDCSSYIGWEVNSAGAIAESGISGTKIGYVAYVSTSDVDAGVSGSRILVIASADAAATTLTWGSNGTARGVEAVQDANDLNGYSNTNTLRGYGAEAHPAAYAAWNYSAAIPSGGATPAHWFMPTKKQWENMRDAKGGAYNAMATAYGIDGNYWTSNEYFNGTDYSECKNYAWRFVPNSTVMSFMKLFDINVRSIFAY